MHDQPIDDVPMRMTRQQLVTRRPILVNVKPDRLTDFVAALRYWRKAEPLVHKATITGTTATIYLLPVFVNDGPDAGRPHDDRPRALALFREHIPVELVDGAAFEGRDWQAG